MFDNNLRDTKETIFIQIAETLHLFALHPTWYTVLGLLIGIAAALAVSQELYFAGVVLWLLNRIFDGLDGTVARVQALQSDLGGYVDILADFVVYSLIPIGLVWATPSAANIWAGFALIAIFYINGASWMFLSAILEKRKQSSKTKKTSIEMPAGLVGGAETIVFYSAFIVFWQWLAVLFWIMVLLVLITVVQRLVWATKHLD